jgi:hypothetical protein
VHRSLPEAENEQRLITASVPEALATILADVDTAITNGALACAPGDLSTLIGRPTTPIDAPIAEALKASHLAEPWLLIESPSPEARFCCRRHGRVPAGRTTTSS